MQRQFHLRVALLDPAFLAALEVAEPEVHVQRAWMRMLQEECADLSTRILRSEHSDPDVGRAPVPHVAASRDVAAALGIASTSLEAVENAVEALLRPIESPDGSWSGSSQRWDPRDSGYPALARDLESALDSLALLASITSASGMAFLAGPRGSHRGDAIGASLRWLSVVLHQSARVIMAALPRDPRRARSRSPRRPRSRARSRSPHA